MFKIPTIMDADSLIDVAFRRAKKVQLKDSKRQTIKKLSVVNKTLSDYLDKYIKSFPSFDTLHPFYRDLFDIIFSLDKLKLSLGSLKWAKSKINTVIRQSIRKDIKSRPEIEVLKTAYGRVSSVIHQIDKHLKFLEESRRKFKKIPSVDLDIPVVIIAGYPNVGKSSMLKLLSSAKPNIAPYPFTTKGIILGHIKIDDGIESKKIQLIEIPGLLDRSNENRNSIERQGLVALKYLPDLIVFVIDGSLYCGYDLEKQLALLEEIKEMFPVKIIIVENKIDVTGGVTDYMPVSCNTVEGLEKLKNEIINQSLL